MMVGKINYCSNYGEIYSLASELNGVHYRARAGGIIGECKKVNVEIEKVCNFSKVECVNNSEIVDDSSGGIIGYITTGKINMLANSYNKGNVLGGDYVGEIVGYNKVSEAVSNCFYYKREDSNLQGIGGSDNTDATYFSGTNGDDKYDYESLEEFLEKQNLK